MFRLSILFCLLFTTLTGITQEAVVSRKEVRNETLNFKIIFYGTPDQLIEIDESNGYPMYHYQWISLIDNAEHPNNKYGLDIYIVPDSLEKSGILEKRLDAHQEALAQIEGNEMQLHSLFPVNKEVLFRNFIWRNKEGTYFQFYAGTVRNKLYILSVYTHDGGIGGNPSVQFVNSFNLINIEPQPDKLTTSYLIDFPAPPLNEKHLLVDKQTKVSIEFHEPPTANRTLSDSIAHYQVTEIQYPVEIEEEIKSKTAYYNDLRDDILEQHKGVLIAERAVKHNEHQGQAFEIKDREGNIILFQNYIIRSSFYSIEVKLKKGIEEAHSLTQPFFQSFKLKKETTN